MTRSATLACCVMLLAATPTASAQGGAWAYAVVSLMGNIVSVITAQTATGSRLDRNTIDQHTIKGGVFDKAALLAADDALKRHDPDALVHLFAPSAPSLFDQQERFFDGTRSTLPEELDAAIRNKRATRLVLITKYRHDAHVKTMTSSIGVGKLEGLGFYVDRSTGLYRYDTGESAKGYLAPFVYIKVSLIDLQTSSVTRCERSRIPPQFPSPGRPKGLIHGRF